MFLLQQHLPTSTEPARPSRNLAPPPTRNVPCLLRGEGMSYSEFVSWVIVPPGGPSWQGHEDAGIHVWHLAELSWTAAKFACTKKIAWRKASIRTARRVGFSQLWQHIFKLKKKKLLRQLSWQQLIFKDEERFGCCSKKIELLNLLAHLAPDCRMLIIPLGGKSRLEWIVLYCARKKNMICLIFR